MKPVITSTSNVRFKGEGCEDLPATLYRDTDGTECLMTAWRLSPEEIKKIAETSILYVYVRGQAPPPMYLDAELNLAPREVDE